MLKKKIKQILKFECVICILWNSIKIYRNINTLGNANRDYSYIFMWREMISRFLFYSEMAKKALTQNSRWTGMRDYVITDLHEEQCKQGEPDIGSAVSKYITWSWGWTSKSMCSKSHDQKRYKIISSDR